MDGEKSFAEQATGAKPPRSFLLDAAVLDLAEEHKIVREDIKRNRIVFEFPDGLSDTDVLDECRALDKLDDFDVVYDLTMQKLVGKPLRVWIRQDDGSRSLFCEFHVASRYQDLSGVEEIEEHPIVINWLVEFMGAHLLKKYPTPTSALSRRQASQSKLAAKPGEIPAAT
jgi:hypothetical protein